MSDSISRSELKILLEEVIGESQRSEFGLIELVRIFKRNWKVSICLGGVAGLLSFCYLFFFVSPVYHASSQYLVPKVAPEGGVPQEVCLAMVRSDDFSQALMPGLPNKSAKYLLGYSEERGCSVERLLSFGDEKSVLAINASPNSDMVSISATLPDPIFAADLANFVGDRVISYVKGKRDERLDREIEATTLRLKSSQNKVAEAKNQLSDYVGDNPVLVPVDDLTESGHQLIVSGGGGDGLKKRMLESDVEYLQLITGFKALLDFDSEIASKLEGLEAEKELPIAGLDKVRSADPPEKALNNLGVNLFLIPGFLSVFASIFSCLAIGFLRWISSVNCV